MVQALGNKLHRGEIQLFCVDHLDAWVDDSMSGQEKIEQQMRYERYILDEVLPLIHNAKQQPHVAAIGCGFGGYQAANIALRHPDSFNSFLAIGTDFDVSWRLNGHMDENAYLNLPTYYHAEPERRVVPGPLPAQHLHPGDGRAGSLQGRERDAWRPSCGRSTFPAGWIYGATAAGMTGRAGRRCCSTTSEEPVVGQFVFALKGTSFSSSAIWQKSVGL